MFANIQNYHNYHNNKLKIKILQFGKLQVCIFKFTSLYLYAKLPNYQINKIPKITKLDIASAFLCHVTSLHMLNLHVFILACTTKLLDYKIINI
jgi:hypothetical protein